MMIRMTIRNNELKGDHKETIQKQHNEFQENTYKKNWRRHRNN
jgi:hypothetical protein